MQENMLFIVFTTTKLQLIIGHLIMKSPYRCPTVLHRDNTKWDPYNRSQDQTDLLPPTPKSVVLKLGGHCVHKSILHVPAAINE